MSITLSSNLIPSLLSIEKLISGTAYLMGLSFIFKALYSLKMHAESKTGGGQGGGVKESAVYMFSGAMLLYFPTALEVIMNTTFGYSQILAYAPIDNGSPLISSLFGQGNSFGQVLALTIQVIGGFAFVRGWVLISRSTAHGQPGSMGQGITHVFGGVLAMNIVGTLEVVQNTLFGA